MTFQRRDGAMLGQMLGAKRERWISIVTDEQRRSWSSMARPGGVVSATPLDVVVPFTRATSPCFTSLLASEVAETITTLKSHLEGL